GGAKHLTEPEYSCEKSYGFNVFTGLTSAEAPNAGWAQSVLIQRSQEHGTHCGSVSSLLMSRSSSAYALSRSGNSSGIYTCQNVVRWTSGDLWVLVVLHQKRSKSLLRGRCDEDDIRLQV
ncbi:hypothetical protein XENOCAPTIV_022007, partial [Xenoophorus captivus]